MRVRYPEVARIDCNDCKNFSYNLKTGLPILNAGEKIPRKEPPCVKDDSICKKVRPGHSDLSRQNMEIYREYQYFRAVDEKPECVVMRYWYEVIRSLEDRMEREEESERMARQIAMRLR